MTKRKITGSRFRTTFSTPTADSRSTGSTTRLLDNPLKFSAERSFWVIKPETTPPSLPCLIIRSRKNAAPSDFNFDDATLSTSTDLKDGSQVGLQIAQDLVKIDNRKFTIGFKKTLSKWLAVKGKLDTNWNASLYSEYKFGNGIVVQSTVASNFVDDFRSKGFLNNNFALGIKLKYDS